MTKTLQSALLAALLCACAVAPWAPDRQARAPRLDGFGTATLTIERASPEARAAFAQGMEQAYAFNEIEAVRSFKAALAQDPGCAMCAWGVAWQLGPTINASERGDLSEARRYLAHAEAHAQSLPPRERALISALRVRYASGDAARDISVQQAPRCGSGGNGKPIDPLDAAYAQSLRALVDAAPDDPDLLSLYAEAELIALPEDEYWDAAPGKSTQRIAALAERLEASLARHPQHIGLNHYLIHAVDDVHVAQRAEAAADRLGALAPKSPHLLHMPSLMRLERWDAVLAEPLPGGRIGVATVLGEMARGTAFARLGRQAEAAQALARLDAAAAPLLVTPASTPPAMDKLVRSIADSSALRLRAELALAAGKPAEAAALQARAVTAAVEADERSEPPMLAAGTRLALGDMQLRAGANAEAERSFRADLALHPHSGWALGGLARAVQAQGRDASSERAAQQTAWPLADKALLAAR